MILISHRGNTNGPEPKLENSETYLKTAIASGFDVETDVWSDEQDNIFLGHDAPTYKTGLNFLTVHQDKLWIHCKNLGALLLFSSLTGFNFFWHENDDYTLTSKGNIWTFPNKKVSEKNIIVVQEKIAKDDLPKCLGICSDYVALYK